MKFWRGFKKRRVLTTQDGSPVIIGAEQFTLHDHIISSLGYYGVYIGYKENLVISDENLDMYFEPVENEAIDIYQNKFSAISPIYKSKKYDYYINVTKNLLFHTNEDEKIENGLYKPVWVYYKLDGEDTTGIVEELNKVIETKSDSSSEVKIMIQQGNNLVLKSFSIDPLPINISTMYNDDFEEAHQDILSKLTSDKKGIILLHGDAGTGKTNYIKNLTKFVPNKKFIFIPPDMVYKLSSPDFLPHLIENRGSVLVIEDAENVLKDRELSSNNAVSSILNISDGFLSDILNTQIICTFNGDTNNMDKALFRKGRLLVSYEFKNLSNYKVNSLLKDLGSDRSIIGTMPLSEVFNIGERDYKNKKNKIGF